MTVTVLPHWFTITEAAKHTGVGASTIRKEIARGNLRARRIGRVLRITDADLRRWMLDGDGE